MSRVTGPGRVLFGGPRQGPAKPENPDYPPKHLQNPHYHDLEGQQVLVRLSMTIVHATWWEAPKRVIMGITCAAGTLAPEAVKVDAGVLSASS